MVKLLAAIDLCFGVIYGIAKAVEAFRPAPLPYVWELDGEMTLSAWYSSLQLALVGVGFAILALRELRQRGYLAWPLLLPVAAFLFLSLDEATMIHEKLGDGLQHRSGIDANLLPHSGFWWLFCLPPFLLFLLIWLRLTARYWRGRHRATRVLAAGVGTFLASAIGVELATNLVPPGGVAYHVMILLEETGEMLGGTIMLWAAWEFLLSNGLRVSFATDPAANHAA